MNQVSQRESHSTQVSDHQSVDEIDLRTLFLNMWAVRRSVIIVVVLVTLAYWGLWAIKQVLAPPASTYSRVIQFTFKGVEQGRYPNGTPFRIADVVSPRVLSEVYRVNELAAQNVPQAEFTQSFTIQSYAPDYDLVVKKYESIISRKGITGEEISSLQVKMKAELEQASTRSAVVSFKPSNGVRLNENEIDKLLLDVPRLWAEKSIDSDGVAKLDIAIYSSKMFDQERFDSLDYMIALDLVQDNVELIKQNIEELLKLPNGQVVDDENSGYRLPDLGKAIEDVVAYDLQQLVTPIQDLGVTKDKEIVKLYYTYKIKDLLRDKSYELAQAAVIRETLDRYNQTEEQSFLKLGGGQASRATPQLDGEFLDRVINLSQQGEDLKYRQELTSDILKHKKKASEIDFKVSKMESVLKAIAEKGIDTEVKTKYVKVLEKRFPGILEKLKSYVEVTNRLYDKLSKENFGYSGVLYKPSGSDKMKVSGTIVSKRDILIYALLFFMALFGTMIIAMMVRWLKKTDK